MFSYCQSNIRSRWVTITITATEFRIVRMLTTDLYIFQMPYLLFTPYHIM